MIAPVRLAIGCGLSWDSVPRGDSDRIGPADLLRRSGVRYVGGIGIVTPVVLVADLTAHGTADESLVESVRPVGEPVQALAPSSRRVGPVAQRPRFARQPRCCNHQYMAGGHGRGRR